MNILVVGSGGREHALCWKIAQSPRVKKIYCAPGNAGTSSVAENTDINADDIEGLMAFSKSSGIDMVCVGPEVPLVAGITDIFEKNGIKVFGPSKAAALLEGSKVFAKTVMTKYGIPTADYKVFDDPKAALEYVRNNRRPLVVKADGLAAGKGVFVCSGPEEAEKAVEEAMIKRSFGSAGERVVIEETLSGEEASMIAVADGEDFVLLDSSQDHKRVFDGDKGPNTGGMGAYSPAPVVTPEIKKEVSEKVLRPLIEGLKRDGIPYKGVIYAGIMVTPKGPMVLEFNVRFGDPETQVILPRMGTDIVEVMERSIGGGLKGFDVSWKSGACVTVVLASGGYPGSYQKGRIIEGLDTFKDDKHVIVFHAGTAGKDGKTVTAGGRVLNVTATGAAIKEALVSAYDACGRIKFDGIYYRKDIGHRALNRN